MERINNPAIYLVLAILFIFSACKKDGESNLTLQLTAADSNKTVTVANGEKILITLGNPGDGGFTFNSWQYNSSILKLVGHTRNYPPANSPIGDFGSDTWQFSAIRDGTSILKITATQSYTITMFNGTILVK